MELKQLMIFLICIFYGHNINGEMFNNNNNFTYIAKSQRRISETCQKHLEEYEMSLSKGGWAWEMLDATGKLPSGILRGNLVHLGDFDMCLNVAHRNEIFGKYCLGRLPLPASDEQKSHLLLTRNTLQEGPHTRMVQQPDGSISAMLGICLPHSCSADDFQEYFKGKLLKLSFSEDLCTSKLSQPDLSVGDIATISFLGLVFYIILISTLYEAAITHLNKKPTHQIAIAFSLITNTKKILHVSSENGQISCLHGIRVISMMWVIIGHRYALQASIPVVNFLGLIEWFLQWDSMIILGATVSVDTFFLLSGLLVAYALLTATSRGFKFNVFVYYLHRILRLTPLLAVIILIHATILKHLGSGPLWNMWITSLVNPCRDDWWKTLLYIQNYFTSDMCLPHSWYLAVDTQLFLLSPLVLLPLRYKPKIGLLLTGIFTVASIISSFVVGWVDEIYGLLPANGEKTITYMNHYYNQMHTRAGPWLMGIVLGYIIFEMKQNHRRLSMNKVLLGLLWIVSLVILCACVFTGQNTLKDGYVYDKFANAIYLALLRPGWALGVSWVIFACINGHGGPVNWFLSLPIFQVVSKLTYSMYLIHFAMLVIMSSQTRISTHFSNLEMMYKFWGDFAFTFGAALIFTLAFESPILAIEKLLFGRKGKEAAVPISIKSQVIEENSGATGKIEIS